MSTIIIRDRNSAKEQPSKKLSAVCRRSNSVKTFAEQKADEIWRNSAPARLRKAWKRDPLGEGWQVWREVLNNRKAPLAIAALCQDIQPLLWGAVGCDAASGFVTWQESLDECLAAKKPAAMVNQRVVGWLDFAGSHEIDITFALECLYWTHLLPQLASLLEASIWWRLVDQLAGIADEAQNRQATEEPTEVLLSHLLAGELPLTLASLMPEARSLWGLRKPARKALGNGIESLTDGEGLPAGWVFPVLPLLAACWTRSRAIGEKLKGSCWNESAEMQFEWFARQALRLTRCDHSLALSDAPPEAWSPKMIAALLRFAGDASDRAAASQRGLGNARPAKRPRIKLPDPEVNSEWSAVSVLAAGWQPSTPRVVVSYRNDLNRIELESSGQLLFSGEWESNACIDGKTLAPAGNWEETCWYSDKECHYLELGIDLTGGARLERQIMLSRHDDALYLSEILLSHSKTPSLLELTTQLPLATGMAVRDEIETRDALLVGKKPLAAILPLALPEWRCDPRVGEMQVEAMKLTLRQQRRGMNLCAPLWFDLSPQRIKNERTWRQLTVGESLQLVTPDAAVAYRIQSGKDQWFVYRSLAPCANRTALGQNISGECLIGQFQKDGSVKEYLEIEA